MNRVGTQGQGGKNQEEKWKQNKKNTEKAEKKENLEAEGDCELRGIVPGDEEAPQIAAAER